MPENDDAEFGKIAVALGFLTRDLLHKAIKLQEESRAKGGEARMGEVCLKNDILDRQEVLLILRAQGKRILTCTRCRKNFNVPLFRPDRVYLCKECKKPLQIPTRPVAPSVHGDLSDHDTRRFQRAELDDQLRRAVPGHEIVEIIGRGGMGTVYRARDVAGRRWVAVKILSPLLSDSEEFVERFFIEAENARKLRHPNIVEAYEAGTANGHKYFLMEYVEGLSLHEEIERRTSIPEKESLHLVRQVAAGLNYAWNHGIIHRDIKPANLMIDDRRHVKICDLGLSKDVTTDISPKMTGTVSCSPPYASPEQGRGDHRVDCRTDTYSLGVTLYHMLTGELPFQAPKPGRMFIQHATVPPPDPRKVNSEISAATARMVLQMLRKIAAHRPTPEDLGREIEEILKNL
ncbi:MAG: serine/threonine protein kinase [Planctomycetota bacterium]